MTIRKRRLFYLHGFDPRGAQHYLSLYRDQAEKQQHAEGVEYRIETEEALRSQLNIRFTEDEQTTETTYQFLSWSDIVSGHGLPDSAGRQSRFRPEPSVLFPDEHTQPGFPLFSLYSDCAGRY